MKKDRRFDRLSFCCSLSLLGGTWRSLNSPDNLLIIGRAICKMSTFSRNACKFLQPNNVVAFLF